MPYFIKTGYWDKLSRAPKGFLNIDLLLKNLTPDSIKFSCVTVLTPGSGIYIPTGNWTTFTKTNYGSEVDVIIPGVLEITRGNNKGIYNAAIENQYDNNDYVSPANTEWNSNYTDNTLYGWGDLSNIDNRAYDNWAESVNYNPPDSVNDALELIFRETTTGRVWQVQFLQWTQNAAGGGFSYKRRELVEATTTCGGIEFGDGTVLSSAADIVGPPDDIYTVVGGDLILIGDTEITLPEAFVNWKIRVFRNGIILDLDYQGLDDPYYTRDAIANTITLSVAASTDEKFVIMAYKKV